MSEDRIEVVLEHQARLIMDLITSIEYLKSFPKYLDFIGDKEPKALWFIHHAIRDLSIIKFTQLYHRKEHYSFNQLRKILSQQQEIYEPLIADFDMQIKPANRLFKKLEILEIRNNHVGHLLSNRTSASIDWNTARRLIDIACKVHDLVNLKVFNAQSLWTYDRDMLHSIFSNDLQSRETYKIWRNMFKEDRTSLDREELETLIKLNWP